MQAIPHTITVAQREIIDAILDVSVNVTRRAIEVRLGKKVGPSDLKVMVEYGLIEIIGKIVTGLRGRPPHIYGITAAGMNAPVETRRGRWLPCRRSTPGC